MKIFISNNASALKATNPTHTVEAEYGQTVVEGSIATLAHHGQRSDQPCSCLGDNLPKFSNPVIAVSHFDLNTLGGVMRCLGVKDYDGPGEEDLFWQVAALVDTHGIHKLGEIQDILWRKATAHVSTGTSAFNDADYFFGCEWDYTVESLNAFWAWSESHHLFTPRDGSIQDVTEVFMEAIRVVNLLIEGDDHDDETQALYRAGKVV